MNATEIAELLVDVQSEVYHGRGTDEDGYPLEQMVFYVVATFRSGRRFAHDKGFNTETLPLEVARARAQHLAARIELARVEGRWEGPVDNDHWNEMYPEYGSEWYQGQGRGDAEMKAWEERHEQDSHFAD